MVVAWEIRDKDGGLVGTHFKEKDAIKARDRLESQGWNVRIEKVFDHHLKDRDPVVKKTKRVKSADRKVPDLMPEGTKNVMFYVRAGDLITSELGIGVKHKGKTVDGVTRLVINDRCKAVPIIVGHPAIPSEKESTEEKR